MKSPTTGKQTSTWCAVVSPRHGQCHGWVGRPGKVRCECDCHVTDDIEEYWREWVKAADTR